MRCVTCGYKKRDGKCLNRQCGSVQGLLGEVIEFGKDYLYGVLVVLITVNVVLAYGVRP